MRNLSLTPTEARELRQAVYDRLFAIDTAMRQETDRKEKKQLALQRKRLAGLVHKLENQPNK